MPDNLNAAPEPPAALDRATQDFLGQKLRAAYAEAEEKPAYLGDPAVPPELAHRLVEVEKSAEVHDKGVEAVRDALGIAEPAHEKGIEAVREALGIAAPPARAED
jgi:hypothetical protein